MEQFESITSAEKFVDQTIHSHLYVDQLVHMKDENIVPYDEENSALSSRQCTVSQVDKNDGNNTENALPIVSASTTFARFGPYLLLSIHRPSGFAAKRFGSNNEVITETVTYFVSEETRNL